MNPCDQIYLPLIQSATTCAADVQVLPQMLIGAHYGCLGNDEPSEKQQLCDFIDRGKEIVAKIKDIIKEAQERKDALP